VLLALASLELNGLPALESLPANLIKLAKNLVSFRAINVGFASFPAAFFGGELDALESVEITYDPVQAPAPRLQALPAHFLSGALSLKRLTISGFPALETLDRTALHGPERLDLIRLSHNGITRIPRCRYWTQEEVDSWAVPPATGGGTVTPEPATVVPEVGSVAPEAGSVVSQSCFFPSMAEPEGTFSENTIDLSYNKLCMGADGCDDGEPAELAAENADLFVNVKAQLGVLDLTANAMGSLPLGIFDGMAKLRELALERNPFYIFKAGYFQVCVRRWLGGGRSPASEGLFLIGFLEHPLVFFSLFPLVLFLRNTNRLVARAARAETRGAGHRQEVHHHGGRLQGLPNRHFSIHPAVKARDDRYRSGLHL
jgi:hypothetical protein